MPDDLATTANLLGALTVALGDELVAGIRRGSRRGESAAAALLSIGTRPGTSVGALGRVIGKEQSTAVRIVDRLEEAGLVTRGAASDDARRVELRLTAKGRREYRSILDARQEVLARALDGLDGEDRLQLHALLDRLLTSLASTRERARNICRLCDHRVCRGDACPVGRRFEEVRGGHASETGRSSR